jgi:glucose/arabinose dehydrogenase
MFLSSSPRQILATACLLCLCLSASATDYHINILATGLDKPWSLAELPDQQGFLVTEKSGRLLKLGADGALSVVSGTPEVYFKSQGGLLDVILDPAFSSNQRIFLSYAAGEGDSNRTTVASARLTDQELQDLTIILEVNPAKAKAAHYGGKLAFLPDGSLLVSVGEGFEYREQAQALDSELGKLLRIHRWDRSLGQPLSGAGTPGIQLRASKSARTRRRPRYRHALDDRARSQRWR